MLAGLFFEHETPVLLPAACAQTVLRPTLLLLLCWCDDAAAFAQ
jgi:hypothetical protein